MPPADSRVAVVTGGAGALGRAIAAGLSRDGSTVVLVDLDEAAVARTAQDIAAETGGDVVGWVCDVSSADANEKLVQRLDSEFGRLDQLVNNAALSQTSKFGNLGQAEWESVMAVNLWGPTSLCQTAVPLWESGGGAQVVNIASRTWLTGGPLAYVSSKAGLVGLTRALAVQLGRLNVTVNAIAPGMVLTPFTERDRDQAEVSRMLEHHQALSLLPRLATAEDVAEAAVFLSSARASFITGEVLHVAGGAQLAPAPK
jgi:NAD(P)-dependent dehydrogenase (short-subunit alcohol dehydrogenase family)